MRGVWGWSLAKHSTKTVDAEKRACNTHSTEGKSHTSGNAQHCVLCGENWDSCSRVKKVALAAFYAQTTNQRGHNGYTKETKGVHNGYTKGTKGVHQGDKRGTPRGQLGFVGLEIDLR
jgi:hypothetical protein